MAMMLAIGTVINCVGVWPTDNKRIMKELFGGTGNVFLNQGAGCIDLYICQSLSNYILRMCILLYVNLYITI